MRSELRAAGGPGASAAAGTRERILDAAQELLQTQGYPAFSFRDLADRIGIKSASVHYYFPSKEDLALALLERYHARFFERLARAAKRRPAERMAAYAGLFVRTFQEGERICPGASFAADYANLPEAPRRALHLFYKENVRWLEGVLTEGVALGEFRPLKHPGAAAAAIFSALEGAILLGRVSRGRSLKHTREWLLGSLQAATKSAS